MSVVFTVRVWNLCVGVGISSILRVIMFDNFLLCLSFIIILSLSIMFCVCCNMFLSSMWCNIRVNFTCKLYASLLSMSFLWYRFFSILRKYIFSALCLVKRDACVFCFIVIFPCGGIMLCFWHDLL